MELNQEGIKWMMGLRNHLVSSLWFTLLTFVFVNSFFVYIGLYKNGFLIGVGAILVTVVYFSNRVYEIVKNVRDINQLVGKFELQDGGLKLIGFQIVIIKFRIELKERDYLITEKYFELNEVYDDRLGEIYEFQSINNLALKVIRKFFNIDNETWNLALNNFRKS